MFNKLFDFNGDGKLDAGEKTLEFMTFMDIMEGADDDDEEKEDD